MAETQEAIADIIKKIRAEADYIEESARGSLKAGETVAGTPFTESDLESALDLAETKRKEADRLEAARNRDTLQLRREIEHLKDERNKAPVRERERLRKYGFVIVPQERLLTKPAENVNSGAGSDSRDNSGNCANLREALQHIKDRLPHMLQYMRVHWEDASAGGYFDELTLVIDAALAEPPRNCDRPECATTKAAQDVWCREDGGKTAYYEWLLAPAAEQEGGDE